MSRPQSNTIKLEIEPAQLLRLIRQRKLVASDFRCADADSHCAIKQLLLQCTAEAVANPNGE